MRRILLVEDSRANLELVGDLLESHGYAVETAHDGHGGLEAARRVRPDLVLCDLHMPGMGGLEMLRRMRAEGALRELRVVAMTAYGSPGERERLLAAGFDGYIAKPIEPGLFVGTLRAFMGEDADDLGRAI